MIRGAALLAQLKQLGPLSKSELVRACGYVSRRADGSEHLHFTDFYEALLEAKGIHFPTGERRRLAYSTHVHFNGNLMVGKAYTEQLGLQPGDRFEIKLDGDGLRLVPVEGRALGCGRSNRTAACKPAKTTAPKN